MVAPEVHVRLVPAPLRLQLRMQARSLNPGCIEGLEGSLIGKALPGAGYRGSSPRLSKSDLDTQAILITKGNEMETIPLVRKTDAVKAIAGLLESEDHLATELRRERAKSRWLTAAVLFLLAAAVLFAAAVYVV